MGVSGKPRAENTANRGRASVHVCVWPICFISSAARFGRSDDRSHLGLGKEKKGKRKMNHLILGKEKRKTKSKKAPPPPPPLSVGANADVGRSFELDATLKLKNRASSKQTELTSFPKVLLASAANF